MLGIGRNVVWLVMPLVWSCDGGEASSPTPQSPSLPATSETSGAAAASSSEAAAASTSGEEPVVSTGGTATSDLDDNSAAQTTEDTSDGQVVVGERAMGARCEREKRLGSLGVNLATDRTIVAGAVSNGVLPTSVPAVSAESGGCQLLVPRTLLCSSCESTQACAGDDQCVAKPSKVSVGKLEIEGLSGVSEVAPNGITLDYSKTILDPFPAYGIGEPVTLRATGDVTSGFQAELIGVPALTSDLTAVATKRGEPAVITWDTEGVIAGESAVFVSFSVNVHGAVTGWIECTAPDTGEFEIPADLVTSLIDRGSSGFPRVDLERRSSAVIDLEEGCVELYVSSKLTLDIELDGLISCHDDDGCPEGQTCNEELACE